MPTFDTPEPISVSIDLGYHVGDIQIAASDRVDTAVEVRPSDPLKKSHSALAEQTLVEYASGTLLVRAPKGWRQWTPWGGSESIDVRIQLPTGSQVFGTAGVAPLRCTGRLGQCRFRTGVGDIQIEEAGPLELKAGAGEIIVDVATGRADVRTAGTIRIGRVDGSAAIKNSNGDTWIGEVTGEARLTAANGAISVDLAQTDVAAKSANGAVRLGEVAHGVVVAQSAFGAVEIGIRDGVAAWLDLETKFGTVQNDLDASEHPESEEDVVEVHAHTSMGNITIYRSFASATQKDEP
jgi:hypothetical protein